MYWFASTLLLIGILLILLLSLWGSGHLGHHEARTIDIQAPIQTVEAVAHRQPESLPESLPEPLPEDKPFYKVVSDCQIPGLAKIYEQVFGCKNNGIFVEFGAYDGEYVSNTCGLADMGWKGIYIEPIPPFAEKCRQRHAKNTNITVVEKAVGPQVEQVVIHQAEALSTLSKSYLKIYENTDWSKGCVSNSTYTVQQDRLDFILTEEKIQPGFDLMVVDVEGFEWHALCNFDLAYWQPTMVIIEIEDEHVSFQKDRSTSLIGETDSLELQQNFRNLREYFACAGYDIVYKDMINTVYVKRRAVI